MHPCASSDKLVLQYTRFTEWTQCTEELQPRTHGHSICIPIREKVLHKAKVGFRRSERCSSSDRIEGVSKVENGSKLHPQINARSTALHFEVVTTREEKVNKRLIPHRGPTPFAEEDQKDQKKKEKGDSQSPPAALVTISTIYTSIEIRITALGTGWARSQFE